jgi:hypothetical protein
MEQHKARLPDCTRAEAKHHLEHNACVHLRACMSACMPCECVLGAAPTSALGGKHFLSEDFKLCPPTNATTSLLGAASSASGPSADACCCCCCRSAVAAVLAADRLLPCCCWLLVAAALICVTTGCQSRHGEADGVVADALIGDLTRTAQQGGAGVSGVESGPGHGGAGGPTPVVQLCQCQMPKL